MQAKKKISKKLLARDIEAHILEAIDELINNYGEIIEVPDMFSFDEEEYDEFINQLEAKINELMPSVLETIAKKLRKGKV